MASSLWGFRHLRSGESSSSKHYLNPNPARLYPISSPIAHSSSPNISTRECSTFNLSPDNQAENSSSAPHQTHLPCNMFPRTRCHSIQPEIEPESLSTSWISPLSQSGMSSTRSLPARLGPVQIETQPESPTRPNLTLPTLNSEISTHSWTSSSTQSLESMSTNQTSDDQAVPASITPAKCTWPTLKCRTNNTSNDYKLFPSSTVEQFKRIQKDISYMSRELAEIENIVFSYSAWVTVQGFSGEHLNILEGKISHFEEQFAQFASESQSLVISGLSKLILNPTTTIGTLWTEISRLLSVLRQRSVKFFGLNMSSNLLGGKSLILNAGSTFPPAHISDMIPPMTLTNFSATNNSLTAVKVEDFMGQCGTNMDIFHFGIISGTTEDYVPIRWTAVAAAGAVVNRSLTLEHVKKHISDRVRIADCIDFELWTCGQQLNEKSFNELLFSNVQNVIGILIDPKITVVLENPDGLASSLVINFSGQYINKADAPLCTIKDLVIEHLNPTKESNSTGKGKAKDSGSAASNLHLYCNNKLLNPDFLALREACQLPIHKLEGFEGIKIIASYSLRKRECTICKEFLFEADFPERKVSSSCKHPSNSCFSCVESWIETFMQHWKVQSITCPQCSNDQPMSKDEVLTALRSTRKQNRYLHLLEVNKIIKHPNFIWCCASGCSSGQIHEQMDKPMICVQCNLMQCAKHNVPWNHGGTSYIDKDGKEIMTMPCDKFESDVIMKIHAADNRATVETVNQTTKACPGCSTRIEKYDGCDHMTCSCGEQFCWDCCVGWIPAANNPSLHRTTCQYYHPAEDVEMVLQNVPEDIVPVVVPQMMGLLDMEMPNEQLRDELNRVRTQYGLEPLPETVVTTRTRRGNWRTNLHPRTWIVNQFHRAAWQVRSIVWRR